MKRFIAEHERAAETALSAAAVPRAFRAYHERQIAYLQAERFAHLLVTLAFGVLAMGALVAALVAPGAGTAAVLALLLSLLVPYVVHYFRLENAVQRWYRIARRLDRALGRLPAGSEPGAWG
jgi:hypothetical protein